MGKGAGTLGRLGKGSAGAGSGAGAGGNIATADDALKHKVKSMEEIDEQRKLARAAERDLKERLQQELDASKVTAVNVMDSWRRIMRTLKVEDLRHDIEVIAQAHERDIDRKDALITTLLKDLDEAEAQFETALRQHLRAMDRLVEIQDGRLATLEADFAREVRVIEEEFATERATVIDSHRAFCTELSHTVKAVKEEEAAKAAAAKAEFEQVREALKRRTLERIHVLESDQDAIMESLEKKLEEAHLQYLTNTDARTQDFKVLSERGQHDTQMNERQQRALKRLNKLLALWRSKMANNVRECEERNETLEEERLAVVGHLDGLKASMGKTRHAHLETMKLLSTGAQQAKHVMEENTALAQRLLTHAENLRAFESESEKVDPFAATMGTLPVIAASTIAGGAGAEAVAFAKEDGAGTIIPSLVGAGAGGNNNNIEAAGGGGGALDSPEAAAEAAQVLDLPLEAVAPGAHAGIAEAEALHHFYGRYNKALVEALALERQRSALRAENQELQNLLQQALDGMAVTPSAVDGSNALLVVNGRVPLNRVIPVRDAPKTLGVVSVEAAIVASTYARGGIRL